jgi:hypothetical protein
MVFGDFISFSIVEGTTVTLCAENESCEVSSKVWTYLQNYQIFKAARASNLHVPYTPTHKISYKSISLFRR